MNELGGDDLNVSRVVRCSERRCDKRVGVSCNVEDSGVRQRRSLRWASVASSCISKDLACAKVRSTFGGPEDGPSDEDVVELGISGIERYNSADADVDV